jgi:hypothetical protein
MVGSLVLWIFSQSKNLCQCHGEYSLLQFSVRVNHFHGTHFREAQDDNTFATLIFNPITDAASAVMDLKVNNYTINGAISGLMLFKCLQIKSKVHAVNDARLLCRKLTKAMELMRNVSHNITQFNIAHRG